MEGSSGMPDAGYGGPPRDRLRASDTDRERVAELLRAAQAEGRLDLAEYDDRLRQVWAARTYGELEPLIADLPLDRARPGLAVPEQVPEQVPDRRSSRRGAVRRGTSSVWLSVSVINLVIWAMVSLSTWHWVYPWWIWVAGPWAAILLTGWITDRLGTANPPQDPPH